VALRLHEFARRIAALSDIEEIVTAMRSLAFVELRRLIETIAHQSETTAARERAIGQLLAHYPQPLSVAGTGSDVLLAIGSERGFCGDFNTTLAALLQARQDGADRLLVVGARLALLLEDAGVAHEALGGATVSDEVPRVLQNIAAALGADLANRARTSGLVVLHHDSDGALAPVRLLPSPAPSGVPPARHTRLQLQLPPRELFERLMDQYLIGRLNAALLASLHAENRRRLEHTGAAIDRLDRELDIVQRQRRRARYEAITEEIEIMLLGAPDGPHAA